MIKLTAQALAEEKGQQVGGVVALFPSTCGFKSYILTGANPEWLYTVLWF